jgi:ribosomal protein L29
MGTKKRRTMDKLIITPKTKIHDLLEEYPDLEDLLITAAPQFKKLRNPLLRRTIARITTLSQAATIGGINVEELINRLRDAAGQGALTDFEDAQSSYTTARPDWFSEDGISRTIDIRDMLHAGEQPVHEVLSAVKKLEEKEILKTIAPFVPAPLIDKAASLGYSHWIDERGPEEFFVYFSR